MIRRLLFLLVGVVAVLAAVGLLLPRQVTVAREIVIDRPASQVYTLLNSWQRFNEWSPWFDKDPHARYEKSGPSSGPGARHAWTGNDAVGTGSTEIIASEPYRRIDVRLAFEGMGESVYHHALTPSGTGTKLRWEIAMDLGMNPVSRYFGLLMDGFIGPDYERGLAKLKALVEGFPEEDIAGVEGVLESYPASALLLGPAHEAEFAGIDAEEAAGLARVIEESGVVADPEVLLLLELETGHHRLARRLHVDPDASAGWQIERLAEGQVLHSDPVDAPEPLSAARRLVALAIVRGYRPGPRVLVRSPETGSPYRVLLPVDG